VAAVVGCAGAFDDRLKKQPWPWWTSCARPGSALRCWLEEGCCGDSARRAGNEMLYQMEAQQNIETMNGKKVKKIVTACPHSCMS